ncbi:hypothetical protein BTA51_28490 [Hahella sp. CCB-MM4]|nr:hypothetical protein BTA51_28490 [Hahella sp. CCB-MM4]
MHIEHINISAPQELLLVEKEFFCEVFKLKVGFRPSFSRDGYWLYHEDNPIIHLTESNEHFQSDKQGYLDHVALQMSGLHDLLRRLNSLSVNYESASVPEIGMTQIFFSSPAGIGLEANFINESL